MKRIAIVVVLSSIAVGSIFIGKLARPNESRGVFPGPPVQIRSGSSETSSRTVTFKLDRGACKIQILSAADASTGFALMRKGTFHRDLAMGETILLTPDPDAYGEYSIRYGDDPFVGLRQWILSLCGGGALIALLPRSRKGRVPDRRRLVQLLVALFVGGIVTGVVHEYSHALVGTLLGGKVARVIWTALLGEEARVVFQSIPPSAVPWMSFAGIAGPFLVGFALFLWLYNAGTGMPSIARLVLFSLGASLLSNSFTLLINAGHVLTLVEHMGIHGYPARIVSLTPVLLSAGVLLHLVIRRRNILPSFWARKSMLEAPITVS